MKIDKISFIGGGAMARSFIQGLLTNKLSGAKNIIASGPRLSKLDGLKNEFGIKVTTSNLEAAQGSDIIVLSVKPQNLKAVFSDLQGKLEEKQVVISIAAGATLSFLREGLKHNKIVRSMPNTPAQIGKGVTLWTGTPEVDDDTKEKVREVLKALGEEIYVEDEQYVAMATAVSGTGPSYIFLFIEAFVDAAVHLGFPRDLAKEMVLKTILGSTLLAIHTSQHPAELKNMVTSPGGTSAEALYQLEKENFRTAISKAVWAAYQKTLFLEEKIK